MIKQFFYDGRNREGLNALISRLDPTKTWLFDIRERKSKRTLEQNSRLWKLYTELGNHIGETPDSVHELCGFKFLRELKTINGETVEVIKSTTKLNTAEMAEYQSAIEDWANLNTGFWFEEAA